jgi:cytosine/adenosine deaminase-related metal-dependent hydrolase
LDGDGVDPDRGEAALLKQRGLSKVGVVRGGHVLTMGPAGDLKDGTVVFVGGRVLEVGPFADVAARHPEARMVGDDRRALLPGLVNAHTHLSEGCCAAWARS